MLDKVDGSDACTPEKAEMQNIDKLKMSKSMKNTMHLVHNRFIKKGFLWPKYNMKDIYTSDVASISAFFFPWIYYFIKGIWRKGLIFFIISILFYFLYKYFRFSQPNAIALIVLGTFGLIICAIAMHNAYYDIYRNKVLKQKFWW